MKFRQLNIQVTDAQYHALKDIAQTKGIYSMSALVRSALVEYFALPTNGIKPVSSLDSLPQQ